MILTTHDLTKRFGELTAIDGVNLVVEEGEFHSLIGPNGAGKTTMFNLLSGGLTPTSGRVELRGENVTDLDPHERMHRGLSRSFQITNVFEGLTVRENVRLAVQSMHYPDQSFREALFTDSATFDEINETTGEILADLGLADVSNAHPETLPYGNRRRLEIGLLLAGKPDVVLLDEPTAGMGEEETTSMLELIRSVFAECTILLVEHDIDVVMNYSDRISVLNMGALLTTGSPEEIAADEAVQNAYLGGHA